MLVISMLIKTSKLSFWGLLFIFGHTIPFLFTFKILKASVFTITKRPIIITNNCYYKDPISFIFIYVIAKNNEYFTKKNDNRCITLSNKLLV